MRGWCPSSGGVLFRSRESTWVMFFYILGVQGIFLETSVVLRMVVLRDLFKLMPNKVIF